MHRALDHEQRVGGGADGGVEVVEQPVPVQQPGRLQRLLQHQAALDELVAREPEAEHEVAADRVPDRAHDLPDEARPILHRPAVGVLAAVGVG